jgi:hypothetical protein
MLRNGLIFQRRGNLKNALATDLETDKSKGELMEAPPSAVESLKAWRAYALDSYYGFFSTLAEIHRLSLKSVEDIKTQKRTEGKQNTGDSTFNASLGADLAETSQATNASYHLKIPLMLGAHISPSNPIHHSDQRPLK